MGYFLSKFRKLKLNRNLSSSSNGEISYVSYCDNFFLLDLFMDQVVFYFRMQVHKVAVILEIFYLQRLLAAL